ncbi:hypothetical protein GCM10009111_25730 [Colwellia asteriadis]|uniref:Uncharacterized protein n=1 Tax=Colwellia asteriadis TaxID=517723 RepID=A0ABN1L907_9GAMM
MSTSRFNALSLSTINASGTSERALYGALTTDMFFGQKSPLEIRVDKGQAQPYFTVPLPALDGISGVTQKQLLLVSCLQETANQLKALSSTMAINSIEKLIISTSILLNIPANTESESTKSESAVQEISVQESTVNIANNEQVNSVKKAWQEIALHYIKEYLPHFSDKVAFAYEHNSSLDQIINKVTNQITSQGANHSTQATTFEQPVLIINIDALLEYHSVNALHKVIDVQCTQGPEGIMPAAGATSTLLIPTHYPTIEHKKLIAIEPLCTHPQHSIKAQLTQAQFSLPSTVLHVGANSEQWTTHWYGQTNSFYHQPNNALTEPSLTQKKRAAEQSIPEQSIAGKVSAENEPTEQPLSATPAKTLTLYNQTTTLGYLGVANLSTAFASAAALLHSPIENITELWLVEHQVNSQSTNCKQAKVYKITPIADV